ncbi:tRNA (guanosine(46)-N7)-methyltransferase TrmB [Tistlia consotensis]|uniref:tRNA (guanosine(46)-N7)-methyltransferase TrmB n=1 Tax=Tistlia consotensis TaxID=1321365 RepID=UPI000A164961|nr:tRNA (guanosine(46)-N7)-methyltransferase TrmB [Tistlia consotensis]
MPQRDDGERPRKTLHGRRQGRPLRGGLRDLVEQRLPAFELRLPDAGRLDPAAAFESPGPRPRALWLEIGFGGGEHLAWQAARHPEVGIIGCEVFVNGIATLLRALEETGSGNVRIFRDDARRLIEALPDACLERVFLLFPDPWPKRRHAKRRFVAPATLDALARVLRPGGELRVASDDPTYQAWALAHLLAHPAFAWTAKSAADWRRRPADWPPTRYEAKALESGRHPVYLAFQRVARAECP